MQKKAKNKNTSCLKYKHVRAAGNNKGKLKKKLCLLA